MATTKECGLIYISKTQKHKYLIVTKDKCEFFFIRLTDDLADKITIHQISPKKILKSVPDLIMECLKRINIWWKKVMMKQHTKDG